ncbi:MAG: selenocysteine-specific translation elongation factor [Deltaproteobacteria bacterium]|nr:selenocysteine-specific translation elongation factor [Deltaproteobacteria bacterium]
MNRYVILGTAGHIDHGKSALVQALTGTDPDRLKEEKERGITIDLGFADLPYSDGLDVGIVDMPGHERLIKNMLAGAGGIDIVLMVIAADEGIMPQSREHLDICNLLKVKRGLIAITKSDLVEEDWIPLVEEEVREFVKGTFLEDAEIIPLSAKTGNNIDLLKEKIGELAANVELKSESGIFRLPVDRIFTLKGFGTVVTGTAVSGSISVEANVEILPKGIKSRVRGLQSHGKEIKKARAGQRVAINLQGVSREEIQRGDVIAIPDKLRTAYSIDADIEILKNAPIKNLKNRSLVHFHTGTTELIGRIIIYENEELKPGGRAFCQIRFKEPVTVMTGDRYIIRRFSPLITIGGGEILDVSPKRRKREERMKDLAVLEQGGLSDKLMVKIIQDGANGITMANISGWTKAEPPEVQREIASLVKAGELLQTEGKIISQKAFGTFSEKTLATLDKFHKENPLKPGIPKEALRAVHMGLDQKVFEALLRLIKEVVIEKDILRLDSFSISLSADKKTLKEDILKILENAGFQPPSRDELAKSVSIKPHEATELLKLMAAEKTLVRINDALYISTNNHNNMMDRLSAFFSGNPEMTVAEFRDTLKTTRKFAIPFLEYLDSNKITLRVGEVRKFLKK